MPKPKIIVILGQTATGKSDFAVRIAKEIDGEIISSDSRQVYKGLDIGTGKITKKEMQGIKHHMLDIANPKRKFTVSRFKDMSEKKIEEILKRKKVPIICGGTGFYIDAIVEGIILPDVPPNTKLRKKLLILSNLELLNRLKKLDKKRAKDIEEKNEVNNKLRLVRAIEIAEYLGKVPKIKKLKPKYNFIKIGLYLPEDKLKSKIERRVKNMFESGLLKEIKKLKKEGVSDKRLKELGFEYYNPTIESVINESIKYSKRQMTWFKKDKDIFWEH